MDLGKDSSHTPGDQLYQPPLLVLTWRFSPSLMGSCSSPLRPFQTPCDDAAFTSARLSMLAFSLSAPYGRPSSSPPPPYPTVGLSFLVFR